MNCAVASSSRSSGPRSLRVSAAINDSEAAAHSCAMYASRPLWSSSGTTLEVSLREMRRRARASPTSALSSPEFSVAQRSPRRPPVRVRLAPPVGQAVSLDQDFSTRALVRGGPFDVVYVDVISHLELG